MGLRVRIAIHVSVEWHHGVQYAVIDWSGSLVVEVLHLTVGE
jgi:hypothetical protein